MENRRITRSLSKGLEHVTVHAVLTRQWGEDPEGFETFQLEGGSAIFKKPVYFDAFQ
jgi:hypothetical protein